MSKQTKLEQETDQIPTKKNTGRLKEHKTIMLNKKSLHYEILLQMTNKSRTINQSTKKKTFFKKQTY